jgi:glutamine synthetase
MMDTIIEMNSNPLVQYLNKLPEDFTKSDLIRYIQDHNIEMVNFRYVAGDGRLKTLNFVINNKKYLENILTTGERVDGSSLFTHIETGASDLYVIPRYRTAFVNPFSEIPSLDILCSFYNKDGNPLPGSPEYVLRKSHEMLKGKTGFSFEVMGELEYYIISDKDELYRATDQKGYHESVPFTKWEHLRVEAMQAIARTGGNIKYGHSEVGNFSFHDHDYEQNEIEFNPVNLEDAADQLIIAKWILRNLAYKYGVTLTFAPKITTGKAGSGLHIHTKIMKDGTNQMVKDGKLSDTAKRTIAGYLMLAPSLTAFGNTNPTSYFRLVPHQEAPTNICWGDRNRSVLVRVPLGWSMGHSMIHHANPNETEEELDFTRKQTVEFRCPDGSADIYLLLSGLCVAARLGLSTDNALSYADKRYVDVNIFDKKHKAKCEELSQLPTSCYESAELLQQQRHIYEEFGVFPPAMIDDIIRKLKSFDDKGLIHRIGNNKEEVLALVNQYFNCG